MAGRLEEWWRQQRLGRRVARLTRRTLEQVAVFATWTARSIPANLWLLLLSFLLAVSLWIVITNEENPPRVDTFPSSLPVAVVNPPAGLALSGRIEPVKVKISAPGDLWPRLSADNFEATVDLSRAAVGEQEVRVRVTSQDDRVRVLEVIPSRVRITLGQVTTQVVPVKVRLQGSLPFGYTALEPEVEVEAVSVRGAEELVRLVDSAVAEVPLDGVTTDIEQSFALRPRTARDYGIEGVTLEPNSVVVRVPIESEIAYKSLGVSPNLVGTPAEGYWVRSAVSVPPTVTIFGTQEVLQGVVFLTTEAVDVDGATEDTKVVKTLVLPEGVSVLGPSVVTVEVNVEPAPRTATFLLELSLGGLGAGLTAEPSPDRVQVSVGGEPLVIAGLRPEDLQATADLRDLPVGLYKVPVQVAVPTGVELLAFEPRAVEVVIREEGSASGLLSGLAEKG